MDTEKRLENLEQRGAHLEDRMGKDLDKTEYTTKSTMRALSRRALNVLQRAKCDTIDDVIAFGPENLRTVYNCGEKTYLEIKSAVM